MYDRLMLFQSFYNRQIPFLIKDEGFNEIIPYDHDGIFKLIDTTMLIYN